MGTVIKMPKLSDTMTEGVVVKWHKKVGDMVQEGELLAEIETDKATMEFESFEDGVLLHIGVKEGQTAPVDDILAVFGKKGEDITAMISDDKVNNESISLEESKPKEINNTVVAPKVDAKIITMPKLSDTMTEGVIVKWHKKVGDMVQEGELLAEIETDKATMEFESFETGHLLYIGLKEGESALVDSVLAIIGNEKADFKLLLQYHNKINTSDSLEKVSSPPPATDNTTAITKTLPTNTVIAQDTKRVFASPLAKRIAKEKNILLTAVKGSGYNGRIIKEDVENYTPSSGIGVFSEKTTEEPLSQMRKTISRRLSESKFSAPHFYLNISILMDNIIKLRKSIIETMDKKVSFNDFVIKAVAHSLRKHPNVNVSYTSEAIKKHEHIHIGVAVAVDEGLVVPVIKFTETKTLSDISKTVKTLAGKAKDKQLQPEEMQGNTFTISNLGMFGVESFTSIINAPESCIMAVGAINKVPVVIDNQIVLGNIMKVTLSCDHRAVDGATGAQFLKTFKSLLENPVLLLGQQNI